MVDEYRGLIGESLRMSDVRRLIRKLGRAACPVLILGETGTGKEVVARAIHRELGPCPFVVVDCASIVGTLLESELFGYTAGAFTGATKTRTGLIEAAAGGIAFFDEIGELPLEFQAKLLRVLQYKEFRSVGSLNTRHVEFRILAATNRNLAREVAAGRFREDLYYRLNVGTIHVPPLRERKEDIPALISHFLEKLGTSHCFTAQCIDAMLDYNWPGNVRELECCIQRLVAVQTGPLLGLDALPEYMRSGELPSVGARAGIYRQDTPTVSLRPADGPSSSARLAPLAETEEQAIRTALQVTHGDCAAAARILGIGRTTLYRKKLLYGLDAKHPKARAATPEQ